MTTEKFGPAGGMGGNEFTDYTIPAGTKIKEIHIYSERVIDAIQLVCIDEAGNPIDLPRVGGLGGHQSTFVLDDDEYLTGISGSNGWYVDDLRFHTNKRISEPFGGDAGPEPFQMEAPQGSHIVGFFGRCDWYIDAIGIIAEEMPEVVEKRAAEPTVQLEAVEPEPVSPPPVEEAIPAPKSDPSVDLKTRLKGLQKVEGIGPKISEVLAENGVPDLAALANTPIDRLKEILGGAGSRYRLADPSTWPEQAALGAAGKWDELKELQAELKGGRRV